MLLGLFNRDGVTTPALLLFGAMLLPSLSGCGKAKNPWETAYPAKGVVTYKGKPLAGAEISLFPQGDAVPENVRPRAKSAEDGSFTLWTYERGDGAPAGTYKATVVHHQVVVTNGSVGSKPNDLPRKYARPDTTDLVVEISQGTTEIPKFELK